MTIVIVGVVLLAGGSFTAGYFLGVAHGYKDGTTGFPKKQTY